MPWADPVFQAVEALARLEALLEELNVQQQDEDDKELRQLYDAEIASTIAQVTDNSWRLEEELLVVARRAENTDENDKHDSRGAVLEVTHGVGGQEAALFAGELLQMYERFAESRGWRFDVEQLNEGAIGGVQNAIVRVNGEPDQNNCGPYGWLRFDSGVHRVQRVPVTDKKGRMQTSSAALVLLPVASEVDIDLPKSEVRIEASKKSSGPGGQSVNAMTQAIRVVHIPTGISTYCASTQSLIDNRNRALEMLRTKLLSQQLAARSDFERNERKSQRGTGDRSEKIRTYNFQRDEVTDHLLGKAAGQKYSAEDILFGDGLEGLLAAHRARVRTEELENAVKAIEARMGASSAAER